MQRSPDGNWWWDGQQWQPVGTTTLPSRPAPSGPTLQQQIQWGIGRGYRVISQTETTAQLVKPKKFSLFWFFAWTICSLGVLFWIYPVWYLAKKDATVYVQA